MKAFFFILSLFYILSLSAQDISVELSIEWTDELNFDFRELDSIDIKPAYLVLTYRNLSDKPLYLYKSSNIRSGGLPDIPILDLINHIRPVSYYELFTLYKNHAGEKYYVSMRPEDWSVLFFRNQKDSSVPTINDHLKKIYDYIYLEYIEKGARNVSVAPFLQFTDFVGDSLKSESKHMFIFLKEREVYRDTFNLIGFQLVGGDFTFGLEEKSSLTQLKGGAKLDENRKWHYSVFQDLPEQVDGYNLYKGEFLTNEVTVSFPGIKLPIQIDRIKLDDEE